MSIKSVPGAAAPNAPLGPVVTSLSAASSEVMEMMVPTLGASAVGLSATAAPASRKAASGPGLRLYTVRENPALIR